MIVCHCNVIRESEIEDAIHSLLDADPWRLIVPAQVYRELKKRARCCGCFPNVVDIIVRVTETYHRQNSTPEPEIVCLIDRLRQEQRAREEARLEARRRIGGVRAA